MFHRLLRTVKGVESDLASDPEGQFELDTALAIVRLIIGLGIFAHGAQKLFGWYGGYGIKGTGAFMEKLGFRPGTVFAALSGLGEAGGGILTLLGLLNPIGPALIVMVMITAIGSVHITKGFFTSNGGWELNSMYIAGALLIALVGPVRIRSMPLRASRFWPDRKSHGSQSVPRSLSAC